MDFESVNIKKEFCEEYFVVAEEIRAIRLVMALLKAEQNEPFTNSTEKDINQNKVSNKKIATFILIWQR